MIGERRRGWRNIETAIGGGGLGTKARASKKGEGTISTEKSIMKKEERKIKTCCRMASKAGSLGNIFLLRSTKGSAFCGGRGDDTRVEAADNESLAIETPCKVASTLRVRKRKRKKIREELIVQGTVVESKMGIKNL